MPVHKPPSKSKTHSQSRDRRSRSRNTTPIDRQSVQPSVESSTSPTAMHHTLSHISNPSSVFIEDIFTNGSQPQAIPSPESLHAMLEDVKNRFLPAQSLRVEANEKFMRHLMQRRKLRMERQHDLDRADREAEERKHKLKIKPKKREPDEDRPLAVGAHGLARQDGTDVHKLDAKPRKGRRLYPDHSNPRHSIDLRSSPNCPSLVPRLVVGAHCLSACIMLFRRITPAAARPLTRALRPAITNTSRLQVRYASQAPQEPEFVLDPNIDPDLQDPNMNGGYINPPPVKRQHRDPYADWWDKQERRNLGEPLHEDNDLYGMFSTWDYTHFTPNWGWVLFGTFVATFTGFCYTVKQFYPDKPSAPRTFSDGLEKELGGPGALLAKKTGEDKW